MNKDSWGFEELALVFEQFSYFLCDLVVVVSLLPILFLTRIRYKPVQDLMDRVREQEQSIVFDYNTDLYLLLIKQMGKLIFDILCLPFALVVIIFYYRSGSVVAAFNDQNVWEDGLNFHVNLLIEFSACSISITDKYFIYTKLYYLINF
jgi:hypothetical protein